MFAKLLLYLKNSDWILSLAVFLLACFGLAEIYGIDLSQSEGGFVFFRKQLFFFIFGLCLLVFISAMDYYFFYSYSQYFYLASLLLLVAVLLFGETINGTRGWFNIFGLGIQPVEFAKISLLLFLARYFSRVSLLMDQLKHLLITGAFAGVLIFLVLLQPDLGSAFLLFFIWLFMIIVAGFQKKYLLIIIAGLAVIFLLAWTLLFKDYQKQRLITFFKREDRSLAQDYNVNQAIIAVGSGGLIGRGLGFGSQSQLKFLPEAKTDFIFAVISEELGLIGVFLVLGCFALLFFRSLRNLNKINNNFASFFILGSVSLLFLEMFINVAMNMGLVPIVGIALPFLSYGGSGLLVGLAMIGIMQSIFARNKIKKY